MPLQIPARGKTGAGALRKTAALCLRPLAGHRGFALLMTLWALVFMVVLSLSFIRDTRTGTAGARNFKEEAEAHYAAMSAYTQVVAYLLSDEDPSVDFLDEEGQLRLDMVHEPPAGKTTLNGIEVTLEITDEESRLNLNNISPALFGRILSEHGVPDDEVLALVDALADWQDPDDLHRIEGAETDYYENLPEPYEAKNGPLDTLEELLMVKGFRPEHLVGGGELKPMAPLLTTWGEGVNLNTAPEEVLELMGVPVQVKEQIMAYRNKDVGGLRVVQQSTGPAGRVLTASNHFRIRLSARPPQSSRSLVLTAVVERIVDAEGMRINNLYWKEHFEYSGA